MLIYENRPSKMRFWCQRIFFSWILISKIGVKMNLRTKMRNHPVDPEKEYRIKSILKPYGRTAAMPTAWELTSKFLIQNNAIKVPKSVARFQTKVHLCQINIKWSIQRPLASVRVYGCNIDLRNISKTLV